MAINRNINGIKVDDAADNGKVPVFNSTTKVFDMTAPAGGGNVSNTGTPADNQIAVWTGATTIEGTSGLTYNGSNLQLTGDIGSTGTRITKGWFTDLQVTNAIAGSITGNAATVTTNANLTGVVTSVGNATAIADAALSIAKTSGLQTALDGKQATITFGTGVQTALGVNVGTAGSIVVNGGALGTPSSGTLTNATGLPIAGLVASTSTALGVGSIELGHASDTTIARVSAGVIAVEGKTIANLTDGGTFAADISVPDEAYGVGWNGSVEVPTKNAIYDKIEALGGGATCLTIIPTSVLPVEPSNADAVKGNTPANNTTGYVGQVNFPYGITVNKITHRLTGSQAGANFKVGLYSEDGQTQILNATIPSDNALETVTLGSPVSVPAGIYYWCVVSDQASPTHQFTVWATDNAASPIASIYKDVTSEPVLEGSITVTASTLPTTFTPSSITAANARTIMLRLDN